MKKIQLFIGMLISLLFLFVLLRNIEFKQVGQILQNINYLILVPAVFIQLMSYWVRSLRWSLMLRGIKYVKSSNLFPIICISYMANNTLPLRLGEFVRAYLIGRKEEISKTAAFSTVILERIYDGLTLLLLLGVTSMLFPFPDWVKLIGYLTAILFLCALIFVISMVIFKEHTQRLIHLCCRPLKPKMGEKIISIFEQFTTGFDVIKNKRNLLPIAFYSILIWSMEGYLFYAIAEAFDFSSTIYIGMFVLVVVNLGIMIPSSPGYVGTLEYFCSKALEIFNVSKELSLSYALVLRMFQYIPITVLGFYFLLREGISISQMIKMNNSNNREMRESQK
ncbi:lysylphosphatidylglycerol synthase transmembrane domain-containing protein [Paenibacillus oryzisoli]|uniref:Phosphatidylglycerol lysyltransferase n=1 Tax=Paenibacillus oryzisoli TaxID=1850517 RepID=A0A198AHV1_9BACL|nr:lysylphosphatidylglycerol synthase transmembrane domain-containing protein [Paenibacillus oryzisoli]OAS20523.1 hypothetical protein A8708_18335 [Paenibacillus oryzisoli]